ncbi:hypothetical protein Cme02nite_11550 [Catellatospora methionotrophica]|uniref:Uncharacterized protein n=1 Tax=Catellatospora methionotrophica TaxID=121620 RepID=A0A8J3L6U8_9ACTN|nr:hypothetical protein [Catellatospora methionotrophica]GIG12823.1 hypothetical protein Cme02nite_11550 [Catellatospora methionotrophica]
MTDLIDSQLTGRPEKGPTALDCVICGHVPAAEVSFYRHVGLVLYVRFNRIQGPFCRDCGLARMRDATAETMISGLWSPVSVVLAPLAIVRNVLGRRTVLALDKPVPRPGQPESNLAPLPPARPVLRRFKAWFAPAVLATVIAVLTFADLPSAEKLDVVNGCVTFDNILYADTADFVRCDEKHDAVITSIEASWQDCDGPYLEKLYRYYCLAPAPGAPALVNVP